MFSIKGLLLILFVVLISGAAFTYTHTNKPKNIPEPIISAQDVIIEGQGWKGVVIGASNDDIQNSLGKPDNVIDYDDVYFYDYYPYGIQINFDKDSNKAQNIFFFNNQAGNEKFSVFTKGTNKGTTFKSSEDEVINKYGQPQNDLKGSVEGVEWRRIEYSNIDFRFENGKMVSMSVF